MKRCIAFFLFLAAIAPQSFAWGPEGHRIVADIAESRLSPEARIKIRQLLGNDDLAAISTWADQVKGERPETFGWHFVDIPANASGFSEARDCYHPEPKYPSSLNDHDNCVVDRITKFKNILADKNAPKEQRVEALKFLVHFVGDVHQPLHAIGEARGGNDIHVVEFGSTECGKYPCNLHFAWDIGLIEHTGLTEVQYVARINELIAGEKMTADWLGTPETWANESFRVAKQIWLKNGGAVDERYYEADIAIVNARLELAGMRLAAMLNQALGK
ncbi:MAG TPA: S1/P1 nuclease [Terriglobales bacterium]|nr:S1/P1 nuclease [Terriglobales bacterium]